MEVGERHLGGGDEELLGVHGEEVVGELGQLVGAEERGAVGHERRRDLLVAVFGGVEVEHPLAERAVQPRQRAAEDGEAWAGELGRALEIHQAKRLADLEVLAGALDVPRVAVRVQDEVRALVGAVRDVGVKDVGQRGERRAQLAGPFCGDGIRALADACTDVGEQALHLGVVATGFRLSDGPCALVAPPLCRLDEADGIAAQIVPAYEDRGVRLPPPAQQGRVETIWIGADRADVMHGRCSGKLDKARHNVGEFIDIQHLVGVP